MKYQIKYFEHQLNCLMFKMDINLFFQCIFDINFILKLIIILYHVRQN